MERYVFSGSWVESMRQLLLSRPDFKPLSILVSQADRGSVKKAINWKDDGFCDWLFIDSGAFSIHTGKFKCTTDEYIDYLNSIDEHFEVCAQLDTIPGHIGQPKTKEDYVESAEGSWKNFLYMRERLKSPNKLMPVFHMGEDYKYLTRILEYVDKDGNPLDYIGLSPANDAPKQDRMLYMRDTFDFIKSSKNPNVKTHIYGFTALESISKFPSWSADSITHRILAGYGKVISKNFGIISISKKVRNTKIKSSMSFVDVADEYNLNKLKQEFIDHGLTLEEAQDSVTVRTVFNVLNIQELVKSKYQYHPDNLPRSKKLF